MDKQKVILGIDLGTTNSLVSYCTEEGVMLIPNALGQNITPSVVSIDEKGEILVGQVAKERQITHPELSAAVFKRYMGTKKKYCLGDKEFLPEELAALIIKALKEDAEHYLGVAINEAVISVPAYFSDAQRKATKRAGELVGLKVDRLITEPTAAALAYGLHLKEADTKFLVFDLGGGTFDISILELFDNVMEVRAIAGDNYLGGEDFTDVLMTKFLQQYDMKESDLDRKTYALLRKQAEAAKRGQKDLTMHCTLNEKELTYRLTLEEYEKATKHLFQRLKEPIERALHDASLKASDIEAILLVGGATKLPSIRTFVSKLFGKFAFASINPDEVVAVGAGIQAALKGKDAVIKEVILTDVCPYTLGTTVTVRKEQGYFESGYFLPIIERNTTIPVSRVERLYTTYPNQRIIKVDVLQGESRLSKDNIFLGELNVALPPRPAGEEAIDVRYTYNLNGILEVEVVVVSTGEKKTMVLEKDPGSMTKEEIAQSIAELADLKIHPRENQENKLLLAQGERLYEEKVGSLRLEIGQLLLEFEEVLDQQIPKLIAEKRKEIKEKFDVIDLEGEF